MTLSRRDFFKRAGQGLLGLVALAAPVGVLATRSWQDQIHDEFCRKYPNIAKARTKDCIYGTQDGHPLTHWEWYKYRSTTRAIGFPCSKEMMVDDIC